MLCCAFNVNHPFCIVGVVVSINPTLPAEAGQGLRSPESCIIPSQDPPQQPSITFRSLTSSTLRQTTETGGSEDPERGFGEHKRVVPAVERDYFGRPDHVQDREPAGDPTPRQVPDRGKSRSHQGPSRHRISNSPPRGLLSTDQDSDFHWQRPGQGDSPHVLPSVSGDRQEFKSLR